VVTCARAGDVLTRIPNPSTRARRIVRAAHVFMSVTSELKQGKMEHGAEKLPEG
jgi:hypothetical protein